MNMPEGEEEVQRVDAIEPRPATAVASAATTEGTGAAAQFREFALKEREAKTPSAESAAMREALRQSYPLPSDTFITETIPVLLARLSLKD
jgi:hypothetical protein